MLDTSDSFKKIVEYDAVITSEKNRGRMEERECNVIYNAKQLDPENKWCDLESIIRIKSTVEEKGKITKEERYYICSTKDPAEQMLARARKHWGIESNHFILDVSFSEDKCKINIGNTPYNIAIIRRFVLNIINKIKPKRISIALFRRSAGWNDDTLKLFVNKLVNHT